MRICQYTISKEISSGLSACQGLIKRIGISRGGVTKKRSYEISRDLLLFDFSRLGIFKKCIPKHNKILRNFKGGGSQPAESFVWNFQG